jgi:hypothetical protein
LIAGLLVPWFVLRSPPGSANATELPFDFGTTFIDTWVFLAMWLIPLGTLVAAGAAVVGLALPSRGPMLVAIGGFVGAGFGGLSICWDVFGLGNFGDYIYLPSPAIGPFLFLGSAAAGVVIGIVDLRLDGSSTLVWRALGRPSPRRFGIVIGYSALLALSLLIGLFPMFPRWFLIGFAALVAWPIVLRFANGRKTAG